MGGVRADREVIDQVIDHLPEPGSSYPLEEVLVGGGEALMREQAMEYLIRRFRQRFPQGPQASLEGHRSAGQVVLALQSMGLPLADRTGRPLPRLIDYWLELGVDYFHIASNDPFHERRRPGYPWEALRQNLGEYGAQHKVEFLIYGKGEERLVPSGRVLEGLPELERAGASLLLDEGYCANAWEAAGGFLSGTGKAYPHCSEVVIDPYGWVHPCCWYELSPGLFNLCEMPFPEGMRRARQASFCQALDAGDMLGYAQEAGIDLVAARDVRDRVGDCGLCRLATRRLAHHSENVWVKAPGLSPGEARFYAARLGRQLFKEILPEETLPETTSLSTG